MFRALLIGTTMAMAVQAYVVPSSGFLNQASFNKFKKGVNTETAEHVDQANNNNAVQSYDQANSIASAGKTASIAQGYLDGYHGPAVGSYGAQQATLSNVFNRGSLATNANKAIAQDATTANSALDTGVVAAHLRSASTINGNGAAGTGSTAKSDLAVREQKLASRAHVNQDLKSSQSAVQNFAKGALNKAASSTATIGQAGPYGIAGSAGSKSTDVAQTEDRGYIADSASTLANSNANQIDTAQNLQSAANNAVSDAVVLGPGGISSGNAFKQSAVKSAQNTLHHADAAQSQVDKNNHVKQLGSLWNKASAASTVGIGSGLGGPGVSTGTSQSASVNGHDNSYEQANGLSSAQKRSSTTTTAFNNQQANAALRSNTVIAPVYY